MAWRMRTQTGLTAVSWLVIIALIVVVVGGVYFYARRPSAQQPVPMERIGGTVTVLGVWGGSELESFLAMVKPFEEATGVKVEFEAGYEFALASPFPEAGDLTKGLWVEDGYWRSEPGRGGGTQA